ncbi:MAG: hypothetical protein K2Q12_03375 [Rickettsiales bacterium]|nr:hypothetical protein [Rickettsiales bacterium]
MQLEDNVIIEELDREAYFNEARSWYSAIYLSVISERYFFIILTTIASLTGLIAVIALLRLLPLNPREPFLYLADNAYEQIPLVKPIKSYRTQDINDALRRFFLVEYVLRREGYSSSTLIQRMNFMRNHSDKVAFGDYAARMDVRNPNSPVQKLGVYANRAITVDTAKVQLQPVPNKPEYYQASVSFIADTYGSKENTSAPARADIIFYYKDLIVAQTKDMEEDKPFQITPMRFVVTDYKVSYSGSLR